MAWVKATSHGDKREFWVNTDKLALIERREGWLYTALFEPGEDGEVYKVEETPEEIMRRMNYPLLYSSDYIK